MTNFELFNKALDISTNAHEGQTDKAGVPYILHPIRVAEKCFSIDEKIVALLHDTIEDTHVTPEYLLSEKFPQYIVDAILSLTRNDSESYECFIKRVSQNEIGRQVKLRDLEDNMDITRLCELSEKDLSRLNKYLKAYNYLSQN